MNTSGYFEKVEDMAREAGTTVSKLCKEAGVSRATVDLWRSGRSTPSFRIWDKLTNASAELKARKDAA